MVRRKPKAEDTHANVEPKGFDDFEVRLGDAMRGERATLGKSLLDVQRDLRIKASYISAIENCDASVFETPGFVAGYVRSYARYLKMDPEEAYARFCAESGFAVSRELSSDNTAQNRERKAKISRRARGKSDDLFEKAKTPFIPHQGPALSGVSPQAVGSSFILLAVIALIAYGAWTVLQEIQKVSVAPVDQAPEVTSILASGFGVEAPVNSAEITPPAADAFDRLYRPAALDIPIVVARDAPISTLNPADLGVFKPPEINEPELVDVLLDEQPVETAIAEAIITPEAVPSPIVVEEAAPQVALLAVQPVWVRVRGADGTVIFEKILSEGEEYLLPQLEDAPVLRSGNSGSLYFRVNDQVYGPAGDPGAVTRNVALSVDNLTASYSVADGTTDADLARYLNVATAE